MREKHRERYEAKRKGRVKWLDIIGYASIALLILTVAYLVLPQFEFQSGNYSVTSGGVARAAIIDQLSSVKPSSALIHGTYNMLLNRGIATDVFLPNDITVAFYASLASRGYDLIILRVHTGLGNAQEPIGLFTNEPYDRNRYVLEQANGLVGSAQVDPSSPIVFAVTPKFIRQTMQGRFSNTIIILGGCYGLSGSDLAQAFVDKGARVVVGWTGLVDLDHTDQALSVFLDDFINQNMSIRASVDSTMRNVGPDPTYQSVLSYYPTDQGNISMRIGDMTRIIPTVELNVSPMWAFWANYPLC
jgi:hypothetical protein